MVVPGFMQSVAWSLADDILEHLVMHLRNENPGGRVDAMNKQDSVHEITLKMLFLLLCASLREPTKLVQILLDFSPTCAA